LQFQIDRLGGVAGGGGGDVAGSKMLSKTKSSSSSSRLARVMVLCMSGSKLL